MSGHRIDVSRKRVPDLKSKRFDDKQGEKLKNRHTKI